MRVTTRHVLLLVVLFVALSFAVDSATAAQAGTQQMDCWTSSGGGYTVCG